MDLAGESLYLLPHFYTSPFALGFAIHLFLYRGEFFGDLRILSIAATHSSFGYSRSGMVKGNWLAG
jgi:hypothetical protein